MRALDLCSMLTREISIQIAYKFANDNHLIQLAERIDLIRQAKFSNPEPEEPVYQEPQIVEQPQPKVFKAPMNPVEVNTTFETKATYPSTPAVKQSSDHLFSSPCITVTDEQSILFTRMIN